MNTKVPRQEVIWGLARVGAHKEGSTNGVPIPLRPSRTDSHLLPHGDYADLKGEQSWINSHVSHRRY